MIPAPGHILLVPHHSSILNNNIELPDSIVPDFLQELLGPESHLPLFDALLVDLDAILFFRAVSLSSRLLCPQGLDILSLHIFDLLLL